MSKSIVGLFDTQNQAQSAAQELTRQGIPAGNMTVLLQQETAQTGTSTDQDQTDADGNVSRKGFFARLGEMLSLDDHDETTHSYAEGVRRGGALLVVRVQDENADKMADLLNRVGAVDVEQRAGEWRKQGWAPVTGAAARTTATASTAATTAATTAQTRQTGAATQDEVRLNVVEEELKVGKRVVQRGGVRVYTHVTERPVAEQVQLREERVVVERHPVNRDLTAGDLRNFKDGTLEVTARAEEVVVSKQARVVEEVVVSKQMNERTDTVRDTLKRSDVQVEQIAQPTGTTQQTATSTTTTPNTTNPNTPRR